MSISQASISVLEKAAKLVTPTQSEESKLEKLVRQIEGKIEDSVRSEDPRPKVNLGGSYARGTWLKGNHDVDFFLAYPTDFPRDKLETIAIQSAKRAMTGHELNTRYAEHPYVESFIRGVRINIVPCYDVLPGEWKSAADRSPYHTQYIRSRLDDNLRLQARLLKRFAKTRGVYGAEVKIQGFSGYVCEVLTLKYGSFVGSLDFVSKLKPGDVVSIEPYDSDLVESFKSPIVILDPVDTTRNLGTAISGRNVGVLSLESRRFLSGPKISFFTNEKMKIISKGNRLLSYIVIISFKNQPRSPDILWGELKRSLASLSEKLSKLGFQVLRTSAACDEVEHSALLFLFVANEIERRVARSGPEYFRAEEVQKYYEKNRRKGILTWVGNDGRMVSLFERDVALTNAESALKWILEKKNIESAGLSPRIRKEILNGCKIATAGETLRHETPNWLYEPISKMVKND